MTTPVRTVGGGVILETNLLQAASLRARREVKPDMDHLCPGLRANAKIANFAKNRKKW